MLNVFPAPSAPLRDIRRESFAGREYHFGLLLHRFEDVAGVLQEMQRAHDIRMHDERHDTCQLFGILVNPFEQIDCRS